MTAGSQPESQPGLGTASPGAAILAALLVPGLPQLRAGATARAAVAFASVVVPFFAGVVALGPRFWFFGLFDPDEASGEGVFGFLAGVMATIGTVLPEALALGPSIVASVMLRPGPEPIHERLERMPIAGEEFFAILTSVAGLLAALWAADAAWFATGRRKFVPAAPPPPLAAAFAWLVPGAAHVWIGRATGDAGLRGKGIVVGAAVAVLFVWGLALTGGQAVDRGNHHVWWVAQSFGGVFWMLGSALSGAKLAQLPAGYDLGVVLCATAGLANILLMVDAYTTAESGPPRPAADATGDTRTGDDDRASERTAAAEGES